MQKNIVNLDIEMATVNLIPLPVVSDNVIGQQNSNSISRQSSSISRVESIKKVVEKKKKTCNEACQEYGWVTGMVLFTTGFIVGLGYLIKLLVNE